MLKIIFIEFSCYRMKTRNSFIGFLLSLLCLLCMISTVALAQNTYIVSPNGDDHNDGRLALSFSTLQTTFNQVSQRRVNQDTARISIFLREASLKIDCRGQGLKKTMTKVNFEITDSINV